MSGWNRVKTHCPQNHPYSTENTAITRQGHRKCLTCRREQQQESRRRKREGKSGVVICAVCEQKFSGWGRSKYCSETCRAIQQKRNPARFRRCPSCNNWTGIHDQVCWSCEQSPITCWEARFCEHAGCTAAATVEARMDTPQSSTQHGVVQDFVYYCAAHYAVVDRLFYLCDVTKKEAPAEAGASITVTEKAA